MSAASPLSLKLLGLDSLSFMFSNKISNMNYLFCMAFGLAMLLAPMTTKAAIVFDFDMDLTMPGIQTSRIAAPGEMFDVGVIMMLVGSPTAVEIADFSFDLAFDNQFVVVHSVSIPTRPTGYEQLSQVIINPNGLVGTFSGGPPVSSSLEAPPAVTHLLGILSITALNPADMDSTGVLLEYRNFSGDTIAAVSLASSSSTLVVTAVPEPSSLLCCAFFVTALGSKYRRTIFRSPRDWS